jgi:hypothetical protein
MDFPDYSPARPEEMDWSKHFPHFFSGQKSNTIDTQQENLGATLDSNKVVEFADVGCGFGGLLIAMAPLYPEKLMLGNLIELMLSRQSRRLQAHITLLSTLIVVWIAAFEKIFTNRLTCLFLRARDPAPRLSIRGR